MRIAWLLPALPALAALVGLVAGRRLPGGRAWLHILATAAASVASVVLLAQVLPHPARVVETAAPLARAGGVAIALGTRVDGLAAVVALMVCLVALAVQVYSTAYLRGDSRYSSYACLVSLFTAAMLLVVLAVDLLELYVGWEVMGICSYFLIGHYWEQRGARTAAVKAFLMTRIGDVGFLFGIFVLGTGAGSFRIGAVLGGQLSATTLTVGTVLLVCGVVGKSAQFPLHTWLPDAMAGPTPISALIHAATMVAAGVYVVARLYPLFAVSTVTLDLLGAIAVVTMLLGAFSALAQDDLKRVLAYSTVSQLAYMLGGLAVGGYTAGLFHLLTHAAYKALLFLAAGSVLHAVGTNSMSEMGGLRRPMPLTFATFVVGAAALAGLPPASGAWSKDAVLGAAYDAGIGGHAPVAVSAGIAVLVWVAGLVTVVLTAAYVTRMLVRVFFGDYRGHAQVDESPLAMTGPMLALALAAVGLGLAALPGAIRTWLPAPYAGAGALPIDVRSVLLSLGLVLIGAGVVLVGYRRAPQRDPARALGRALRPLERGFYLDELYAALVVRPVRVGLVAAAIVTDRRAVDAAVDATGNLTRLTGAGLRRLQNGNVQAYATGLFLGVVALAAAVGVAAR